VKSRYEVEQEELAALLEGEPAFRASQIFDALHQGLKIPSEMTNISKTLRGQIDELLPPALIERVKLVGDKGMTTKWAFALHDGAIIETVLMEYRNRVTVCVSSQAGCAMNCSFCATGQAGFSRHLTTGEIVEQVITAAREAAPRRLSNVVFMGMGEPLANYNNLTRALRRLSGPVGISARHLTVSTVGMVPAMAKLADERLPVSLAVSLHAANDELRSELVPINKRYPLDVLHAACASYFDKTHRRISFEWALIDSVNDRDQDIEELAEYASSLAAHVNLIPLNPTPGYLVRGSTPERVKAFAQGLEDRGVTVTVRNTRGREIDAACGQLAGSQAVSIRPNA